MCPKLSRLVRGCAVALLAGLLAGTAPAAVNANWFARAWQTEDGLPEHTLVGLEQTPDGFLWVATHRSLSRFDGVQFKEFMPAAPADATTDQIRALLADRRGRLWLARDGGRLMCLEQGRIARVFTLPETSPGGNRAMAEDSQGDIWLSDSAGAVFRIHDGAVQTYGRAEGLAGPGLCWLTLDGKGQLWFAQGSRVGIVRQGRFETLTDTGWPAVRIFPAREEGVWVCAGLKLFRTRDGKILAPMAELKLPPGQVELMVSSLWEDRNGGLWLGTGSSGLFQLTDGEWHRVEAVHPNIIKVLEDSEGNLWVGTRGGGLNRLSPRAFQLLGPASGLPFAAVLSAGEDKLGRLWVVGQNGGLAWRSNGVWHLSPNNSIWRGGANCVAAHHDGSMWVGTHDSGLFQLRDGGLSPWEFNSQLPNLSVRALHVDARSNLWIAVSGFVIRCPAQAGQLQTFALPPGASDVRALAHAADGDLWMGTTSDGLLLRIHGNALINETANVMGQARHIRCLQSTSDGSLWFGFAGQGLGRLKQGKFFQYRKAQGLWDEYVSQILPDDRGGLWLAGNRGAFQLAMEELEAVATGQATRMKARVFGRGEGVPNLQASFGVSPVAARTADERLFMPTLTGLLTVQPRFLRRNPLPPPVVLERLAVNGRLVAAYDLPGSLVAPTETPPVSLRQPGLHLHLAPGVNRLELEFTALSLGSPENVSFRYQLEGLEQDWVEAGSSRVARYPRVPPGRYRFRVTACNADGIWNRQGAVLALTVTPYLWEATWFRWTSGLVGSGLVIGLVWIGARRRYRRKLERLEQQRALERERTRIAQDLHDDLGAGLVEINFGSELAQDTALNPEEVREHTREIGARAREMVTALDEIVWAVNPKHDDVSSLATYFCQFAQHFLKPTTIRCHLEVDRNLPARPLNSEQRHSLFMAFKEALSNAAQHSGATDLWLAITAQDGTLRIEVRDNGRGFDLTAPRERTSADGLGNMSARLEKLGGRFEIVGRAGEGMTVVFVVPLTGRRTAPIP